MALRIKIADPVQREAAYHEWITTDPVGFAAAEADVERRRQAKASRGARLIRIATTVAGAVLPGLGGTAAKLQPKPPPSPQERPMSLIGSNGINGGWSSVLTSGINALGSIITSRQQAKMMSAAPQMMVPGILGGAGRVLGGIASRALPALPGAGAVVRGGIAAGRGLASAAQRWCARNPKACGALGGAGIVAEMMRTGELKRPGRRMNPMNVRAMRRAIRRVKAGRKIARQIESLLPRRAGSNVVHATPSRLFHAKK